MSAPRIARWILPAFACTALSCYAQSGLRVPERAESGIDPAFARGWLAPNFDRFGFASFRWRDAGNLASQSRADWSYSFGRRGSLGLSLVSPGDYDGDQRPISVFGRYWFAPDWAVSAETNARDGANPLRFNDFRIGVQRRF